MTLEGKRIREHVSEPDEVVLKEGEDGPKVTVKLPASAVSWGA